MRGFSKLFSRSPFAPMQSHMEKVANCVEQLGELYNAFTAGDFDRMVQLAEEISELEHMADLTKNEIRNSLPKGIFLAINRGDLLEILALQDTLADKAEDIAILMTLKPLKPVPEIEAEFKPFLVKNMDAFHMSHRIIRELDELLETSFGGKEAEKVNDMVEQVAFMEHEADVMQRQLLKKLFSMNDSLHYSDFILWMNILQGIAALGNLSEKLANRIRMLLELK